MKGVSIVVCSKYGQLNFRSTKFLELMDNAEKAIEKVNADQIYTSKQFMRIRDDFYVSLIRKKERDWLIERQNLFM